MESSFFLWDTPLNSVEYFQLIFILCLRRWILRFLRTHECILHVCSTLSPKILIFRRTCFLSDLWTVYYDCFVMRWLLVWRLFYQVNYLRWSSRSSLWLRNRDLPTFLRYFKNLLDESSNWIGRPSLVDGFPNNL